MGVEIIKLYGERRSGTGYTTELLDQNLVGAAMDRNVYGSRHNPPKEQEGVYGYVFLVRDPFYWLKAFHDEPFGCPELRRLSFAEFLHTPVRSFTNGRVEDRWHDNPVTMWNDKVEDYTNFALENGRCCGIRYEDARDDPKGVVLYVCHSLKLTHQSPLVDIPNKVIAPGNVSQAPFKKRTVVYSNAEHEYVLDHLDVKLAAWWGYEAWHGW